MDDLKVSSTTLKEHISDVCILNKKASENGFELKLLTRQFNHQKSSCGVASATVVVGVPSQGRLSSWWTGWRRRVLSSSIRSCAS